MWLLVWTLIIYCEECTVVITTDCRLLENMVLKSGQKFSAANVWWRSTGNIAAWKKAEGDEVAAGDSIAEVETDKV